MEKKFKVKRLKNGKVIIEVSHQEAASIASMIYREQLSFAMEAMKTKEPIIYQCYYERALELESYNFQLKKLLNA